MKKTKKKHGTNQNKIISGPEVKKILAQKPCPACQCEEVNIKSPMSSCCS